MKAFKEFLNSARMARENFLQKRRMNNKQTTSSSGPTSPTPALLSLDLENDLPSVLQFNVGVNDIGGTLVAELAINQGRVSR